MSSKILTNITGGYSQHISRVFNLRPWSFVDCSWPWRRWGTAARSSLILRECVQFWSVLGSEHGVSDRALRLWPQTMRSRFCWNFRRTPQLLLALSNKLVDSNQTWRGAHLLYSAAVHYGLRAHALDVPRLLQSWLTYADLQRFGVHISPGGLFLQNGYSNGIWLLGVLDLRTSAWWHHPIELSNTEYCTASAIRLISSLMPLKHKI